MVKIRAKGKSSREGKKNAQNNRDKKAPICTPGATTLAK